MNWAAVQLSGEGRAQQRKSEVKQVGKETDKQAKHYAASVKPVANTSRKVILLELGKGMAVDSPKSKSLEGD